MFDLNLELFDLNPNTTSGISAEMQTYYCGFLIDNAKPNLVHDQFAQFQPIPANGGKTINFRRFMPFSKASTPLVEGVTPDGGSLSVTSVSSEVSQYGYYVTLSDVLTLTSVDNTLVETTKLLGSQAGSTLDTVTREVLNGGTNVMYAGSKTSRIDLDSNCKLTVDDIYRAARYLKTQNAPKIDGSYVAIIHPDVAYDIMRDDEWIDVNKYAGSVNIFEGEIGKIAGVRFVETTEAKIFHANDIIPGTKSFSVSAYAYNTNTDLSAEKGQMSKYRFTVDLDTSTEDISTIVGKKVTVIDKTSATAGSDKIDATICGAADDTIWLEIEEELSFTPASGDSICVSGAGAGGRDVYSTLILGANAYGVTEVTGGGLNHIVKQLGSGGTADPLNQRSTAGWKGIKTAELLVDNYIIRYESASTFESGAN